MARKKIKRLPGIKTEVKFRDANRRFSTQKNSVSEEIWKYREAIVKGRKVKIDLQIEYLPYRQGHIEHFGTVSIPVDGPHAGKLIYDARAKTKSPLEKVLGKLGVDRHDTRIDVSMTAKTKSGEIIKRKVSVWHYNSYKLKEQSIAGILYELFYRHGDRPAYPVKIVKGSWRNRQTTRKETTERRQLYDVKFNIVTDVEKTRKQARKTIAKKKPLPRIQWGMDFTKDDDE